ncbi:MAG TPA: hypothetical protein VNW52_01175 [Burkholderiaceae bacterium]|jgi:hypothetical protein|nr:hypothetical protein [Burkholderiaceae bacterium]
MDQSAAFFHPWGTHWKSIETSRHAQRCGRSRCFRYGMLEKNDTPLLEIRTSYRFSVVFLDDYIFVGKDVMWE